MSLTTDPIADMIARIRNSIMVRKNTITLPHSNMKESIAKLLKENKYISEVSVTGESVSKVLTLNLFNEGQSANITSIKRISTPGRRSYASVDEIPTVRNGRGLVILSTSKGMMTGAEAKANRVGGEVICEVY